MAYDFLYVGTYTAGESEGIYLYQLDRSTGELARRGVAARSENPSYLAIDAARGRLYSVNEVSEFNGRPGGSVMAFSIDASSGDLSFLNQKFSHGAAPCYLALHHSGHYLFAVNYTGGNVVVFPVGPDGALHDACDVVNHSGRSLDPHRQQSPHPHSILLDAAKEHALVPDLGLDRVMQYSFDAETGRLQPNLQPWTAAEPGSGPRHVVLHPTGAYAYVVNELSSTVTAYTYDPSRGTLEPLQTTATIPEHYSGANIAADLHLTPNGRFLYASNRGHDSLAAYAVDQQTGTLVPLDVTSTLGKTPRGFAIDPTGTLLLAANQDSHNIVTFWINQESGTLTPTGYKTRIPSPVCLKLMTSAVASSRDSK